MEKKIQEAIEYVKANKTWSEAEEAVALERINRLRCDLRWASDKIYDAIYDLMEEFGDNEGLPEGWWMYEISEDDVFFALED